jgi:F0F1-type ATP synthase assembly protein I
MPFLNIIPALILIGAMIGGFNLAGRWAKTVPMQMLVGLLLGFGILIGVVCVLFGVLFAGCLIMGSPSFH